MDVPWEKGGDSSQCVFVVEVWIRKLPDGSVQTHRRFQSHEDIELASSLDGGGIGEVSLGLFLEALRQEALLQTMLCVYAHPGIVDEQKISEAVGEVFRDVLKNSLPQIVRASCKALLTPSAL